VRANSEILAIWAALKQLSENKNDAMCVLLLRLMKKNRTVVLLCNSICGPLPKELESPGLHQLDKQ